MTVDEINLSFKMDTPDWCETIPENIRNLLHVVRYLLKSILLLCEGDSSSKNIHQDTQESKRRILLDGFILNTGVVESKMVSLLSIIKKAIHSQMDSECYHYVSEAKSSTSTSSTHNSTNGSGTNNSHDVERHNVTSTGEPKQQDLSTNDLVGSVEKEKLTEFTVEKSKIGKIWLDHILSTFTIREKKKNTKKRNLSEQNMSNTNITNNNKNSEGEDLEETSSVLLSMILYEIMVQFVSSSESLNHQDNKNRNFSKLIVNVSSSCLSSSSSQQLSQVSAKPKEKRRNIIDDTENELFLLNANNRMNNNFHEELIREAIRSTKKKKKQRYDDDMTKNKTSPKTKTTNELMSEQLSQHQQQQYEQAKYKAIQKNLIILIESIFLQATISSTLSNFKTNANSFNRGGLDIVPITSTNNNDNNKKRDDDIMVQTASQQLQKQKFKYELYELKRKTKAFVLNDIASIQILMKKIKEEISHFYPASKAQSQEKQQQQEEVSHQPFCRVNASLCSIYYSTPAKRKNNEDTSSNLLFIQITIPGNNRHYPIHHRRHKKRNNNKYNASSSSQPSTYICVLFPGNNMLAMCTNSSLSNILHQSCSSMNNNIISSENKTRINNKTVGKIPSIPVDSITIPFLFTSCSTPQQIEYTPFVLASLCSSMCDFFKDNPYSNNDNMNSLINNHHDDRKRKDQESAVSSTRRKNSSSQRSYQKKRKGSYHYRESVNLNVILRQQKQTQQYKQHQSDPISLLLSALHMQHKSSGVGKFAQLVNNLDSQDNDDHNNNGRRNKTSDEDANNNSNNPLVDLNAASTNPSSSTNRNRRRNQQRLELSSKYGLKTSVLAASIQSNFHNDSYNHHCDSNNIDNNEKSFKVNESCKDKSSVFSLVASSSTTSSSLNNERATKGNKSHVIVEKQSASSSSNTNNSMNSRAPSAPISLLSDKSNLLSNSKGSTTEVQTNNANNTRGFGDPAYLPRIEKLVYKWSGTTEIVDTSSKTKTSTNDDDINNNQLDGDVNDLVEASFKCTVSFQGSHVYQGLQALLDCGIAKHPLPSYVIDAPMMESNVIRVNNDGFHAEQSNY